MDQGILFLILFYDQELQIQTEYGQYRTNEFGYANASCFHYKECKSALNGVVLKLRVSGVHAAVPSSIFRTISSQASSKHEDTHRSPEPESRGLGQQSPTLAAA